jgi:hypothetical protein
VEVVPSSQSDDWFFGASLICAAGESQVATTPIESWNLATAAGSLCASSLAQRAYAPQSEPSAAPELPQAEWAAEAISNLRHVVAGVSVAFIIEGVAALCIFATWNLWHIR